ncbi:type VI secretion system contractile sheath protein TssC [Spirosoma endbachense]|uniref:Type VI secretion system contractile sheath protein TssC n=1 Tax=Spirosoma endbachense TaxID=2666025 RepID=A0A6P1VVG6_9BACT|nr:type VI secretion system contractile sheath protein TssC [Spirosoma endbachense]QHV96082.1 type VI secretion system contractile sheath protein TssC [Spirosoma endbachense]
MAKEEQNPENAPLLRARVVEQQKPTRSLTESVQQLTKFGGFEFIKTVVDGTENMDPSKKARKSIFLTEEDNKQDRKKLKKRLRDFADLLAAHDNVADMIAEAEQKAASASNTLKKNLATVLTQTEELEASYRSLSLFFENAESEKVKNLVLFDAGNDMTTDADGFSNPTGIFEQVAKELRDGYDKLDLSENYSLLVLPGWLKKNVIVDKWASLAYQNKVMMLTDYRHLDDPDSVEATFERDKLTGADPHKANVMMPCNWIVGREAYTELGQEEHLYVSPAMALAGMLWGGHIAQPSAGVQHGKLKMASGVRFSMRKGEIAQLEDKGLIPMVYEYGRVIPFSAKTLFNGDNVGLQTYSVVRVFDWIGKVFQDFLNRRTFENIDNKMIEEIKGQVASFLATIRGPGKIIEDFSNLDIRRHPTIPTHVIVNVKLKPFFPAKVFEINLTGTKGQWDADLKQ